MMHIHKDTKPNLKPYQTIFWLLRDLILCTELPECVHAFVANMYHLSMKQKDDKDQDRIHTLTCWLGKAEVRRVSWVSSAGFFLGMLRIKAAWSHVAAVAVMRYPLSHLLCIPSLGYKKSSSTT